MSDPTPPGIVAERPAPLPLAVFADEVLTLYAGPLRAGPTRDKVRQVLGQLVQLPGVETTADLTPATVARWVAAMMDRRLSAVTIDTNLGNLRAACAHAVRRGLIDANPVEARRRWLPYNYDPGRVVEPSEAPDADLIDALMVHLLDGSVGWEGHRLFALVATVLYGGLLRNEALKLRAEDCDLERRSIRVRSGSPARRTRAMPPKLAEILADWLPRAGSPHAFPGTKLAGRWNDGSPGTKPIDRIRQAGRAVGIEGLNFKRLRAFWSDRLGRVALPEFERRPPPRRDGKGPQPGRPGIKPRTSPPTLRLPSPNRPPIVRGVALARPLSARRYLILKTMIDAGCLRGVRLSGKALDELSGLRDTVRELYRIAELPGLEDVIDFPVQKGRDGGGGYGLKSC